MLRDEAEASGSKILQVSERRLNCFVDTRWLKCLQHVTGQKQEHKKIKDRNARPLEQLK